jgi:hypothetical protein
MHGLSSWPSSLNVFGPKNEPIERCTLAIFYSNGTEFKNIQKK